MKSVREQRFRNEFKYICSDAELEILRARVSSVMKLASHARWGGWYTISNPDIDFSYTVAGAAAACYCFLGFDTFFFVNLSVIAQYFVKQKERSAKDVIIYLIFPIRGALLCLYLLAHLDRFAIILGCAWTVAGIIYLLVLTKGFKQEPPELGIDD